jgi:hypothetical protein
MKWRPAVVVVSGLGLALLAGLAIARLWSGLLALSAPPPLPPGGELAFETLDRRRAPDVPARYFPNRVPGLMILAGYDDLRSASRYVNDEAISQLRRVNWETHFAVLAFRGWQAVNTGQFQIDQIVRAGDEVAIYASTGYVSGEDIPTSPYHVVVVQKTRGWQAVAVFRYVLDGEEVARR